MGWPVVLATVFLTPLSGGNLARASVINFDDGTAGTPVGDFYASLGVHFSNALFSDNFGLPGSDGPLAIKIESRDDFQVPSTSPIVITFDSGQSQVGITGIDVGDQGFRIDAYDAVSGGTLIGFDQAFGTDLGVGEFFVVSVSTPSIRRVELYQPSFIDDGDGIIMDDLTFTPATPGVPEPSTLIVSLLSVATVGLGAWRHRSRRRFA